jgi:hypothetical protein
VAALSIAAAKSNTSSEYDEIILQRRSIISNRFRDGKDFHGSIAFEEIYRTFTPQRFFSTHSFLAEYYWRPACAPHSIASCRLRWGKHPIADIDFPRLFCSQKTEKISQLESHGHGH